MSTLSPSTSRVPPSLSLAGFEARATPSHRAKTLATRLPATEMRAVEAAAKAANQTCSEWLREAAIAHLKRATKSRKPMPDPTLLTELLGLRQLTINLLAAAATNVPTEKIQQIVRQADAVKEGKAEEMMRRIADAEKAAGQPG